MCDQLVRDTDIVVGIKTLEKCVTLILWLGMSGKELHRSPLFYTWYFVSNAFDAILAPVDENTSSYSLRRLRLAAFAAARIYSGHPWSFLASPCQILFPVKCGYGM